MEWAKKILAQIKLTELCIVLKISRMKEVQKSHVIFRPVFLQMSLSMSTTTELTLTLLPLLAKERIIVNVYVLKRAWYSVMDENAGNTEVNYRT